MDQAFVFTSFSVNELNDIVKEFYATKLGFELGAPMTADNLKIVKGGQRVHIYPKRDHTPASFTLLNFKVEDVDQVVDALTDVGISFEQYNDASGISTNEKGIASRGSEKMAWFKDPAGKVHGLLQN